MHMYLVRVHDSDSDGHGTVQSITGRKLLFGLYNLKTVVKSKNRIASDYQTNIVHYEVKTVKLNLNQCKCVELEVCRP